MSAKTPMTYHNAGVNIDAGNELVERIKSRVAKTFRPGVLTGLGGFGALFELDLTHYRQPVLVSATDGVGTKLKLALQHNLHVGVGIDLVAMCVNDLIVQGAEPLFFLDYYASGQLDVNVAEQVIASIAAGCEEAGAALIGGETAELPGMYHDGDYDLAGFCVGIVDKANIIDGRNIDEGDAIIALASSGPHSNGYSLIRKLIETHENSSTLKIPPARQFLTPTRIYVKPLLSLMERFDIKGLAHITGGGLIENIPRTLPSNVNAVIDRSTWQWPDLFQWIQRAGNVSTHEMLRTFNCGVGMILFVKQADADPVLEHLVDAGEQCWQIGTVRARTIADEHVVENVSETRNLIVV